MDYEKLKQQIEQQQQIINSCDSEIMNRTHLLQNKRCQEYFAKKGNSEVDEEWQQIRKDVENTVATYEKTLTNMSDPAQYPANAGPLDTIKNGCLEQFPELKEFDSAINKKIDAIWQIKNLEEKQNLAVVEEEAPVKKATITEEKQVNEDEVVQKGHLYPVKQVTSWTNTLKEYNKQMDAFLKKIDEMDPVTVDMTWVCQKIEAFCRKINYALAMLRYRIINALSGMYSKANDFMAMIEPIATFNPADIFACLGWIKNVINFFAKPYMTVVTFIKDFMTYTPPLISEATSLVSKAATVPAKLITKIDFVAEDKETGEQKQLGEVYKQYINIKMEPITLADVQGGEVKKPQYAEFAGKGEQLNQLQTQQTTVYQDMLNSWDKLMQKWQQAILRGSYESVRAAWPQKYMAIENVANVWSKDINLSTIITTQEALVYVFGTDAEKNPDKYYDVTFNSARYPLYLVFDAKQLYEWIQDGSDIKGYIENYYFYNTQTGKKAAKLAKAYRSYVDFLKTYSNFIPEINTYLEELSTKIKNYHKLQSQIDDLNKVSIFK